MSGDRELSLRLDELVASAELSAPVTAVDPAAAVRRGRKVRGRRRAVLAAGVAAVLLGSAAVGVFHGGGGRPVPAGPVESVKPTPAGRNPFVLQVRFGWLPDQVITVEDRWTTAGADQLATAKNGGQLQLWAFGAGVDPWSKRPQLPAGQGEAREAAPKVNGQEAYWVSVPGMGDRTELVFRGSDGGWLDLVNMGASDVDRQVLLHVAAGVRAGRYEVPLPVSLEATASPSDVEQVSFTRSVRGADIWSLSVSVSVRTHADATVVIRAGSDHPPTDSAPTRVCASDRTMWWCAEQDGRSPGGELTKADVLAWWEQVTAHGQDDRTWHSLFMPPR
ncbi:hypothetical protein ACIQF6_35600 [Kitasatospora sp. NPDC092948]|uniref:hypothetical protein n=1 Tax=Kitasatospora sp. NPDC092948 TaxID=3364088 RepID=UPI00380AA5FF